MDPHGFQQGHHGHTVVDWRILVGILATLLFFTFLTVSAANFEKWIAGEFNVVIPTWINVAVVISIATVKATLVCMYFMQLRYDKPLNAIIFLFCIFGVGLFLGFSALDLGARGRVYDYKGNVIQRGGDGTSVGLVGDVSGPSLEFGSSSRLGTTFIQFGPRNPTLGKSIVQHAKDVYIAEHGQEAWDKKKAEKSHGHGHGHDEPHVSTAQRSIARTGLTPDLYNDGTGHRDEHAEDPH
jgi:cytochrome c oxidase subunit 4